jgi:hypothetical protein
MDDPPELIWTGSQSNGIAFLPLTKGALYVYMGDGSGAGTVDWIAFGSSVSPVTNSFYAISEVLTVPGATTPEPSTVGTISLGVATILFAMRRRSRGPLARKLITLP